MLRFSWPQVDGAMVELAGESQMKTKVWMPEGTSERYRLQLRQAVADSPQQPLWDRSGAARKFVLRQASLEQLAAPAGRKSNARH